MNRQRASRWERMTAFVFGVGFFVVLLAIAIYIPEPSEFQIFVFRVILAAAAAGVGAIVPGLIVVTISAYVRAGGAIALFVIVYFVNPPALATGFTPFDEAIRRGEASLAASNETAAISFFEKARQARPKSWIPYHGLGRAEYERANYNVAQQNFKRAFELGGQRDGSIAYAVSMTQEALKQYDAARGSLGEAAKLSADTSLASTIAFDTGLINLLLWLEREAPKRGEAYREADAGFQTFLERRGSPTHWAHYHLACLRATRSEDRSLEANEAAALRNESSEMLESAVRGLAKYGGAKASAQREMMLRLLQDSEFSRKPGDPVPCPALERAWTAAGRSTNGLIALLQSPRRDDR